MRKQFARIFFKTAVPFGALMGAFYGLASGLYRGITLGLVSGILFGGIMTAVLGALHARSVRTRSSGAQDPDYGVLQRREVRVPAPYDETFQLCVQSLEQLPGAQIQDEDPTRGVITAQTARTWDTWGDTIALAITDTEDDCTHVTVSSEPTRYQVVDYGKNLENVERIASFLKEEHTGT